MPINYASAMTGARAMTGPRINKNGRDWHVYRGVVPFDRITGAYFFPCLECVTREKLRRAGELVEAGKHCIYSLSALSARYRGGRVKPNGK